MVSSVPTCTNPLLHPWGVTMRVAAGLLWALTGTLACHGGALSVRLAAAWEGEFRPGAPLLVRVSLSNGGPAFEGTLDLVVEGLTFRQPVRVGAQTTAAVEALAVARSDAARARVVVRSGGGEVLFGGDAPLGLRRHEEGKPLVAAVGLPRPAAEDLFGGCRAAVRAEELPTLVAGYAAVDGLGFGGDGGEVPAAARVAIAEWVRGGGVAGFVLDAKGPVRGDSLLAELGGCAGRPSAEEWLAAVAARQSTLGVDGTHWWRLGLGTVCARTPEKFAHGLLGRFLKGAAGRDEWADAGLYTAFRGARWGTGLRWRLVGGAVALLAAGALAARFALRGRGRWLRAALVAGVAAALAAVAWGLMLPSGRGSRETACVLERVQWQAGERRTEIVCLEALGRTRVRLDFGAAEAVVPFYHSAEGAGGGGAVVERDASGRWRVECALTRGSRRCFAAWWPWREAPEAERRMREGDIAVRGGRFAIAGAGGKLPEEDAAWQPLEGLPAWGEGHGALAAWQARRVNPAFYFRAGPEEHWDTQAGGTGLIESRGLAAQVWVRPAH